MPRNNGLVISKAQARAIDAAAISELGLSGLLLMENASRGVCEVLEQEFHLANPISAFLNSLDERGRGMPEERHRVLFKVIQASRTFSVEDLWAAIERTNTASTQVSRAIVYRTVHALAEIGLLTLDSSEHSAKMNFGRAFVVCGPGNNGGDGIALTRHCHARGLPAILMLISGEKPLSADAAANLEFLTNAGIEIERITVDEQIQQLKNLAADDIIVDCLLGTGANGAPREPFRSVIAAINQSPAKVLAVDVPSGLDCDTGIAAGACVQADKTITFVGIKQGYQESAARRFTGSVAVADIGIPLYWLHNWLKQNPVD